MGIEEVSKEFNYEMKPDRTYAQILIQISPHSKAFEEAKKMIEDLGVRIIEMDLLSSDFILLKLGVRDMRNIALKLIENGFSVIKGMNALTPKI